MPTYSYDCVLCGDVPDRVVPISQRYKQTCACGTPLHKKISAALFKFAGQVTPGGGPDRFTADMLGIPLKELPEGLKT